MSKLLRAAYRIFIKNRFIRWVWMLALAIWGVRVATERGLAWKKAPLSKTIIAIPSKTVSSFTIRQNEDEDITFTLADTNWLVVKNNITLRLPADSIQPFLSVFEKMDAIALNILTAEESENIQNKKHFDIAITKKNNTTQNFSVYFNGKDSISQETFTYIKLPNENALQGIKGDLLSVFSKDFNDFRDKTLLNFKKDSTIYLTIKSPVDSYSFVRHDNLWVSRNSQFQLSQNAFQKYVSSLQILRGPNFYDGDRDILTPVKIDRQLVVYLPTDTVVLTSFKLEKGYILHSTQNKEVYFRVDSTTNIFPNLTNFLITK
jgi:hypothetical protein